MGHAPVGRVRARGCGLGGGKALTSGGQQGTFGVLFLRPFSSKDGHNAATHLDELCMPLGADEHEPRKPPSGGSVDAIEGKCDAACVVEHILDT